MSKRLVIWIIRKRLHLKKYQKFQFDNQKSNSDFYYFTDKYLLKVIVNHGYVVVDKSNVSLKWILSNECRIHTAGGGVV